MRVRLLEFSDKHPHSAAPEWVQSDIEAPKPQKLAQTFFLETQVRADGVPLLIYGYKTSTPEFPWHQHQESGFGEFSNEDVSMTLRIWMFQTFEHAFPITRELIEDTLCMLAAVSVLASQERNAKKSG
ncbi:MAG: hypothetical protein EA379_00140 [Phycisphaerales bacterium]|nr:MAG: hypothetical protein EA379_00140 [Phycisphaerales bacterium]